MRIRRIGTLGSVLIHGALAVWAQFAMARATGGSVAVACGLVPISLAFGFLWEYKIQAEVAKAVESWDPKPDLRAAVAFGGGALIGLLLLLA
jgi:hypothetical protein